MTRPTAAVVGSGVAGLTAAYLLQRRYDVTLFEADGRLGGHAHTHELPTSDGGIANVDSGFIVHNERTYPNLLRLFGELGVATQESDMSMSVRCEGCGLEYAGARKLGGLFPQASNVTRPAYLKMLGEVVRFHRHARRVLADERAGDVTLGAFLSIGGYSRYFTEHFMLPVVSAVWSAGESVSMTYPARYLFTFLNHHGLLSVGDSPQWRTVTGGSRSYVEKVAKELGAISVSTPVRTVTRTADGLEIRDESDAVHRADKVVIATHPEQALGMLADPTADESAVLGAFEYSQNTTQLHHDTSVLPRRTNARASWNYLKSACSTSDGAPVLVSYDMNRLQRLSEPDDYVVTLNGTDRVDQDRVIATMHYEHPIYTPESVAAQRRLPALNDGTVAFAGAYHGWGFHEDGCAAGVRAAASLGSGLVTTSASRTPAVVRAPVAVPALYDATVTHVRKQTMTRKFDHSIYLWLVDIDALPELPRWLRPFARFESRDHLGDPQRSIRQNLDAWLAGQGIDLHGGQVLMLANARLLGYVFNPISVYWCHRPDGSLECVVAEVHNTYGERHCYLLHTDHAGHARTPKDFYVSPFLTVDGEYRMSLREPDDRLGIAVTLHQEGAMAITATVVGTRRAATPAALVRMLARRPLMTYRTSALIRRHGITLWLRRLPVIRRPKHHPQEGVQ